MSILFEFAMFPTDKGESVSPYVSRLLKVIDDSRLVFINKMYYHLPLKDLLIKEHYFGTVFPKRRVS